MNHSSFEFSISSYLFYFPKAKQHFRRTQVAQELLQTEGAYVKNLQIIIKVTHLFLGLFYSEKRKLKRNVCLFVCLEISISFTRNFTIEKTIHYNWSCKNHFFLCRNHFKVTLLLFFVFFFHSNERLWFIQVWNFSYNSMLLETLNERMRHWSSQQKIGDVFLYIIDFLKVYTEYVNNFDKANDTLQQSLKNNPRLENFLKVSLSFFQRWIVWFLLFFNKHPLTQNPPRKLLRILNVGN